MIEITFVLPYKYQDSDFTTVTFRRLPEGLFVAAVSCDGRKRQLRCQTSTRLKKEKDSEIYSWCRESVFHIIV